MFALAASGTHVVRRGESLHTIAQDHGTTVRALVEANGISNPNLILAGRELTIPGGSGGGGTTTRSSAYTVRVGDTLASIASRHGTTVSAIAAANGISNPNLIVIGRSLQIAGGAAPAGGGGSTSGGGGPQLAGQRHTVQRGDTIAGIAARYGLRTQDLIAWNGLVDGRIYATTRLVLFNPGSLPGSGGGGGNPGGTHTVQSGQTLGSIAAKYGISTSSLASANGISDPRRLQIGQKLTVPAGGGGGGGFVCPVPGSSFFNDWGFPRSGGRSHAGNDMFAPRGTAVRAPVAGRVDIATGAIGGKQFRLTAPDGSLYFGSHMDSFGATGQVSAGTVIGTVGDTGNARGGRPHLHFEVHPGGRSAANPFPLLRASC
ncbi:MAG TPA: LysM peptidoglycan-binding domain-containing M23 family metallopeptidase [Acidimicrobiales bacterium]|nr:LysM peptidoglycan-binding domain-containing M23 family metallopeptidase [Acidimicrobiales bacterium]